MLPSYRAASSSGFRNTWLSKSIQRNEPKPLPDDVHLGHLLFVLELELIQFSHCLEI